MNITSVIIKPFDNIKIGFTTVASPFFFFDLRDQFPHPDYQPSLQLRSSEMPIVRKHAIITKFEICSSKFDLYLRNLISNMTPYLLEVNFDLISDPINTHTTIKWVKNSTGSKKILIFIVEML